MEKQMKNEMNWTFVSLDHTHVSYVKLGKVVHEPQVSHAAGAD